MDKIAVFYEANEKLNDIFNKYGETIQKRCWRRT